jgi:predicted Rossmann fold flavoprotein
VIAIIGAGASGLVAAIVAARLGAKVCIFEKNTKVGKKILATGNGRCNITNEHIGVENFHGQNPSFVKACLKEFNTFTCKNFFEELGILVKEGQKGRLYPYSGHSSSVVELLVYECERLGVEIFLESEVLGIEKKADNFALILENKVVHVKKVLVATGGLAMPSLGSSQSGYMFAKAFQHTIIPTHPSLVQLVCEENLKPISGVKCEGEVSLLVDNELCAKSYGDILFTDYGVSGSAILDISREASSSLMFQRAVMLKLDVISEFSKEQLKTLLHKRLRFAHAKSLSMWLDGFMNPKLARFVERELKLSFAKDLSQKEISKLIYMLKNFTLHVKDTKGFKTAEVTAGGVDVNEINPTTLESKLVKNLFFSGEVIDIDGDCGGYNLHWAWASGYMAGKALAR